MMSRQAIHRLGSIGVAAGALGALSAVVLLMWPPQVAPGPVSYPLTSTGFRIAQAWFFVHHFGLIAVLVGLATSGAVGSGRIARIGAWSAVAGALMLAGAELLAMPYANADFTLAYAGPMGAAYGIATTLIGAGMIAAGIGVLRTNRWSGWHRWIPLAIGIAEFVVLTPGILGGFVAARLAIGFWMVLFGFLGWGLRAESGIHTTVDMARIPERGLNQKPT